jgi:hypothetical protein
VWDSRLGKKDWQGPWSLENAKVFVWFSLFPNRTAWEQHAAALADSIREEQISGNYRG